VELGFPSIILLVIAAAVSSIVSGMMGMGGVLLLPAIASVVDVIYIVPFFSSVILFSNGARILLFFRFIRWEIVGYYICGVLPGAALGMKTYLYLPPNLVKIMMGVFILMIVYIPISRIGITVRSYSFVAIGFVCGAVGIFFGVVGPLLAPFFLQKGILKEELIATKACCQAVNHMVNILVYGAIGAHLLSDWGIVVGLGAIAIVGTFIGKRLLNRLSRRQFVIGFKALLTVIAGRIVILEVIKLWG
jgi:uncharacterized membrane protein YfcA